MVKCCDKIRIVNCSLTLTLNSTAETFLQYVLVILKQRLQNYYILKKPLDTDI